MSEHMNETNTNENISTSAEETVLLDQNGNPIALNKVLEIITRNNEIGINFTSTHFDDLSEAEKTHSISHILRNASVQLLDQSKQLSEDEQWKNAETPINPGSLYDDISFEIGVYLTSENALIINPSFGQLTDPTVNVAENTRSASDALLTIANEMHQSYNEEISSESNNTTTTTSHSENNNTEPDSSTPAIFAGLE